ncbi:Conserved_hypothetical protein [Hexamita inflata]|uniref:Uncharacterized protein n=1 Tax=Hexamita inflata TaxID=28002 RepID=A0AA86R0J4_9EUKA|nr:Conserved hypothetical protein [Hexamita inflata]
MIVRKPTKFNQMNNLPILQDPIQVKFENDRLAHIFKQRVFNGELSINNMNLRDLSFIQSLDLKVLELINCQNLIPKFSNQTIKELRIDGLNINNFNEIQLQNLEVLKIQNSNCEIQQCDLLAHVQILELHRVKNALQLLTSNCRVKELSLTECDIESLSTNKLQSVEVLTIQERASKRQRFINLQNITSYYNLRELFIQLYNSIDTTPLLELLNLQTIKFKQCNDMIINLNGDSINKVELNNCKLKCIQSFTLKNLKILNIYNFGFPSGFEMMNNIKPFQLQINDILSSLINIQIICLKELDLSGNEGIDLSFFKDIRQISSLNLSGCQLRDFTEINPLDIQEYQLIDISQLQLLVQLEKIYLRGCSINRINVLSFLINLKELDLAENNLNDLSPLCNLVNLTKLNLENCTLCNIDSLKTLINLEELNLQNIIQFNQKEVQVRVVDISSLKNLMKLTILNLNSIGKLQLINLSTLIKLKQLYLACNELENITALKYLTQLEILDLRQCQLTNIDTIKSLINLKELNLRENLNINITPLQYLTQLTKLEIQLCGLLSVDALIPLQKLQVLNVYDNSIVYAQPLEQLKQLVKLKIMYNSVIDFSSYFVKFFDLDSHEVTSNKYPTAQEIQQANISKNLNQPVSLLNSIQNRYKQLSNKIEIKKKIATKAIQEHGTYMTSFVGKVVQLFVQLTSCTEN